MSYEYVRFILFTFRDTLFPHVLELIFLPLCVRHGKHDTDRFFRVIRCFISIWLKANTLLYAKQLYDAIKNALKFNRKQKSMKSKFPFSQIFRF